MQPQPFQKQKAKANHDKHVVKQSVAKTFRDPVEKHMQALSLQQSRRATLRSMSACGSASVCNVRK
jgi:hypothetical protein